MDEKVILAPMIKGIMPGLPEIGKIKIGMKGQMKTSSKGKKFQLPQRVDHFIVTTLERGPDGNFLRDEAVHQNLGQKPTSLSVSLLYDDPALNFTCRWACFTGTQLWCTGDGENAYRKHKDGTRFLRECPCDRNQPDFDADQYRCKPSGVLSIILDDMQVVGGVYKFRTTSYNSVINLMSSLALIQRITGGVLAGIPLHMTVRPKTVIIPKTQKTMVVYVVGLEYRGSIQQLSEVGYKAALENATHRARIDEIEAIAKKAIEPSLMLTAGETETDIAEEFYPEALNDTAPSKDTVVEYTPEDFNNEFEAEMKQPEWSDFWQQAANFHAEQGISEDRLKADILTSGAENFRNAFNNNLSNFHEINGDKDSDNGKMAPQEMPEKVKPVDGWNPLIEKTQGRYSAEKRKSIIALLEERGVEFGASWSSLRLHSILLSNEGQGKEAVQEGQDKKNVLMAQAEMLKSDAWAQCQAYKEHYPDIYNDEVIIMGGKEPKTIEDCEILLGRMKEVRDARDRSQIIEDDIPY
jgi:hypothetical protein